MIKFSTWQVFVFFLVTLYIAVLIDLFLIPLILWVACALYYGYALSKELYKKLPAGHDLSIKKLKFHTIALFTAIAIILLRLDLFYASIHVGNFVWIMAIISLFIGYCFIYVIWFLSKTIGTIEYVKVTYFSYYSKIFLLLWVFPIGFWFIYPKIRKILAPELSGPDS